MLSKVLIAGGGIAALEAALALRALGAGRVDLTLVAPEPDFVVRPMLVAEPLGAGAARRVPLRAIAADAGCEFVRGAIAAVEPERGRVLLRSGAALPYDTLVLAVGARTLPAFDGVITLPDSPGLEALRGEIASGSVNSVAFVAPEAGGWLLPLYEAALLTANAQHAVEVALITPEERPLERFGEAASAAVAQALSRAGVEFIGGRQAHVSEGEIVLRRPAATRTSDRVVALPLVRGPEIPGVPRTGLYGLVPVDEYGSVDGLPGVYAIGDLTDFPVKQGGIASRQAEAAASHIAARHGAPVTPQPFRPELRATLLTGAGEPIPLNGGQGTEKLRSARLARYLARASAAAAPSSGPARAVTS
jgi:sulfide:quinone oxidoreductase